MSQSVISRSFRGATLYLTAHSGRTLFTWSADKSKAEPFETAAAALAVADRAAREYGADCAVIDAPGNLIQPAAARGVERETLRAKGSAARALEFATITAQPSERGPHCAQHAGFTDGCAGCWSHHEANSI